jgi:hypothetical protein
MILFLLFLLLVIPAWAADIQVDAGAGQIPISPAIYGKNNCLSDDPGDPHSAPD